MLIPKVDSILFTTTEQLKSTKLNFVICEEPYALEALYFEKRLLKAGYHFNVIRFKNIAHFAERYLMMSDEEKDNIHIFYTHHHDNENDEKIIDSVAEEMKQRQRTSNENINILIAGININYDVIPVDYLNERKKTLSKNFDIIIYHEHLFSPAYWLTNGVNSLSGSTFYNALFYTLFENLRCRSNECNARHITHDLINRY